jgi:hypothetical protein
LQLLIAGGNFVIALFFQQTDNFRGRNIVPLFGKRLQLDVDALRMFLHKLLDGLKILCRIQILCRIVLCGGDAALHKQSKADKHDAVRIHRSKTFQLIVGWKI